MRNSATDLRAVHPQVVGGPGARNAGFIRQGDGQPSPLPDESGVPVDRRDGAGTDNLRMHGRDSVGLPAEAQARTLSRRDPPEVRCRRVRACLKNRSSRRTEEAVGWATLPAASGSADFQSAVSRVSNLQGPEPITTAYFEADALPIGNRRYSRLEICATKNCRPAHGLLSKEAHSSRERANFRRECEPPYVGCYEERGERILRQALSRCGETH